jgi:hypothetical protein
LCIIACIESYPIASSNTSTSTEHELAVQRGYIERLDYVDAATLPKGASASAPPLPDKPADVTPTTDTRHGEAHTHARHTAVIMYRTLPGTTASAPDAHAMNHIISSFRSIMFLNSTRNLRDYMSLSYKIIRQHNDSSLI